MAYCVKEGGFKVQYARWGDAYVYDARYDFDFVADSRQFTTKIEALEWLIKSAERRKEAVPKSIVEELEIASEEEASDGEV